MNALLKICTLLLFTPLLSHAVQSRPSVSGLVVRVGTADPVSDAEVTLNVAPPPAAFLAAANSSAARGVSQPDLTAMLIQLLLLRPQEFQIALNQLRAQGWPEMLTLLNEWQAARDQTAGFPRRTVTDGSGRFSVADVPSGQYWVIAKRDGFFAVSAGPGGGGVFAWGRTSLDISNRDLEGVTIGVHASLDVTGVVIATGAPLPAVLGSARVVIQPAASTAKIPQYQGVVNRAQTPKADGSFTVPTVAEGSYRVQVPGLPPNSYIADIQQNSVSVYDSGFVVTDKTPAPLEIRIAANGGTVEGTVYTSDKKPVAFATVTLVPGLEHRQNPDLFKTVTSDALGRFVISGVRPDEYKLLAWDKVAPGASQNASFVAKYEAQGSIIRVVAGSKTTTDVSIVTGESAR